MAEPTEASLVSGNRTFYAAFEALELSRMSEVWARDSPVSCVHPGWDLVLGHEAVMASWREILAATSSIRFELQDVQATLRAPEAGWVVCREVLYTNIQGQPVENVLTAINTFVWERGAFRICHHHAAPRMAGRPQPRTGRKQTIH